VTVGQLLDLNFVIDDDEKDPFEISYDLGEAQAFTTCEEQTFDGAVFLDCVVAPNIDESSFTSQATITVVQEGQADQTYEFAIVIKSPIAEEVEDDTTDDESSEGEQLDFLTDWTNKVF
jgi:hypothetical protein